MMAMEGVAACALAPVPTVPCHSRQKPEVYRTVDSKVIVEDELLNSLAVKSRTLSQDEIVLLVTNTFNSEWIEASNRVLFELCPTSQRNVAHK